MVELEAIRVVTCAACLGVDDVDVAAADALDAAIELIGKNLSAVGEMVVDVEPKPAVPGAKAETPPPN